MKFQIRFADQIVGLFIILALLSVVFILVMMGMNQRWFSKDYEYTSSFKSGNGLSVGMPITYKGFQIGSIDEVELLQNNNVKIIFHIFDTYYDKVRKNSVLQHAVSPIALVAGGMLFHPGKSPDLIPELSFIPSSDSEEGKELIAKELVEIPPRDDAVLNIINDISPLLESITNIVNSLSSTLDGNSEGPIGEIIEEISVMITKLNKSISAAMISANEILLNTRGITSNLEITTSELTETKGLVTHLLDPKGSFATLLDDDDELYKELFSIIAEAAKTTEELTEFVNYINSTQPQISELLEGSREAIIKGKDVLEGLSNNPLLRGGITAVTDQPTTFRSYEEEEF
jgi:phospholipid/cholesterol/gamma-HCH transport system substrate-binding protein